MTSYMIINKANGKAIAEVFEGKLLNALKQKINKSKYNLVPVREYLSSLTPVRAK